MSEKNEMITKRIEPAEAVELWEEMQGLESEIERLQAEIKQLFGMMKQLVDESQWDDEYDDVTMVPNYLLSNIKIEVRRRLGDES